jgi:hypothetical protein
MHRTVRELSPEGVEKLRAELAAVRAVAGELANCLVRVMPILKLYGSPVAGETAALAKFNALTK